MFDFLCFNLGNFGNESKDRFVTTDLMNGRTIFCIQDVKAFESHFCCNDNSEMNPLHVLENSIMFFWNQCYKFCDV
jgi:hypothetical protein